MQDKWRIVALVGVQNSIISASHKAGILISRYICLLLNAFSESLKLYSFLREHHKQLYILRKNLCPLFCQLNENGAPLWRKLQLRDFTEHNYFEKI